MNNRAQNAVGIVLLLATFVFSVAQAVGTREAQERSNALAAKVGLARAIQTAEQNTSGKAVSADMEFRDGKASYEIITITQTERRRVMVDPNTGDISNVETEGHARKRTSAVVAGALAQAVTNAESSAGRGKALEAEYIDMDEGKRIRVDVARSQDAVERIEVEASTGRVLKAGDEEHRVAAYRR